MLLAAALVLALPVRPAAGQDDGPAELLAFVDPLLEPVVVPSQITAPPALAYGLLPAQLTPVAGRVLFVADDRQHGPELWVSDGTAAGTRQVVDLLPGAEGSRPWILGVVGERVVFWAQTATRGVELHASDGTAAGTVLLADTCPGECSGSYLPELWFDAPQAAPAAPFAGGLAVSASASGGAGCALWTTDGTPGGTGLVDASAGRCGTVVADGTRVWYGSFSGNSLRVFDAAAGGRGVALPFCSGSFFWQQRVAALAGELVVLGRCFGVRGERQAWRLRADRPAERISPRTAALTLLADGDRLLLALASDGGAPGSGGYEVVSLDGPGTGPSPVGSLPDTLGVELLAVVDGKILVQAHHPEGDRLLALVADGSTELLTTQAIDLSPHGLPVPSARVGAQVAFFDAVLEPGGRPGDPWRWDLWTTGGTPSTTRRVATFTTPASLSGPGDWRLLVAPEMAVLAESLVLAADDGAGQQLWGLARGLVSPWGCQPDAETLCLADERFAVRVDWRDPRTGRTGSGQAQEAAGNPAGVADAGYFWFFRPGNLELLVKVLDGTAANGHHWVFHGPMTDLEYDIHVTDLATGATRTYHRPAGSLCGGADTIAFPATTEHEAAAPGALLALTESLPESLSESLSGALAGPLVGPATGPLPAPLAPLGALGARAAPLSPPLPPCGPDTALCLGEDERFLVQVHFENHRNGTDGVGRWVAETRDSGSFWFFRPGNREVLVKVLDGRPVNGRFWIFVGAMTDLAFDVDVFDRTTNASWSYHHPQGTLCGAADTTVAF